jgi:hypothetical protein
MECAESGAGFHAEITSPVTFGVNNEPYAPPQRPAKPKPRLGFMEAWSYFWYGSMR